MEEEAALMPTREPAPEEKRCPECDSVVPVGSARCIMCGAQLTGEEFPAANAASEISRNPAGRRSTSFVTLFQKDADISGYIRKLKTRALWVMIAITTAVTLVLTILILRSQGSEVILALQPTFTPPALPPSLTPATTPGPTETPMATSTPVPSATPVPTDTPRPPRFHSVASGESLFGLSLFYRVSAASIAESNAIPLDSPIQVGQDLNIPWPTATPPLESMVLEIGGEQIVADVTECEIITIQEGDSAYGLSAQREVPAEAIIAVNRLTEESIQLLHPGDTLCIPRTYPGDTLPATVGPEPTATGTTFPAGPSLLYPVNGAEIDPPNGLFRLQWVSVKDLDDNEWYMVELSDLDNLDSLPYRAFTRDSSFELPEDWRPDVPELHEMRWRVGIVRVTGERSDGRFIYEYGGSGSEESRFFWLGAAPTSTPAPTLTPTSTPEA
jgi:LysM repeat protein